MRDTNGHFVDFLHSFITSFLWQKEGSMLKLSGTLAELPLALERCLVEPRELHAPRARLHLLQAGLHLLAVHLVVEAAVMLQELLPKPLQ